jgi:glutathione S-transferase
MAEFQLYCIAQSGNAYRAALMLNLIGTDWEPIWVDFFAGGTTRRARLGRRGCHAAQLFPPV